MSSVTLGGERLGSGKKEKVHLRNYERSTHDLGYFWKSTISAGTLVPFMTEVALPGDSFDIDLDVDAMTHPTIGPLFGSYKIQVDVFQIPIRLYQGKLHMNQLNIGLKMSDVKLPQIGVYGRNVNVNDLANSIDNHQINPSTILSHLNIRGLGYNDNTNEVYREFNAVPYLAYWDIYKNYYSNKQEEIGAVIHNGLKYYDWDQLAFTFADQFTGQNPFQLSHTDNTITTRRADLFQVGIVTANETEARNLNLSDFEVYFGWTDQENTTPINMHWASLDQLLIEKEIDGDTIYLRMNDTYGDSSPTHIDGWFWHTFVAFGMVREKRINAEVDVEPKVHTFPLDNIDKMREEILMHVQSGTAFKINEDSLEPYCLPLKRDAIDNDMQYSILSSQEGLALKTYQSDLFNNWISTEWIDGDNGINEITKVNITDESFTIDELNMSRKIYDMLNRIAVSGGSYDDWIDAVYTHERSRSSENPMYIGGLIKELAFQEVISNAQSADQPLGTLAGRGKITGKHKGGKVKVRIDEPSYIMGIVSLTPRLNYSQGNKWDTNLLTMDDFHKPALDEIGFQDLITDQMHWATTLTGRSEDTYLGNTFKSAGKQPAWINYMTNVDVVRGNFAVQTQEMFMVLNRRYETKPLFNEQGGFIGMDIKDLTTYIDPSKFNHIFANPRRDAQNFWMQIKVDITARRKMSAKVMPNL